MVEDWEWEHLEHIKQRDGETADYFDRKARLEGRITKAEALTRFKEKYLELSKIKSAESGEDNYQEWRDNKENWSEFSKLIRR